MHINYNGQSVNVGLSGNIINMSNSSPDDLCFTFEDNLTCETNFHNIIRVYDVVEHLLGSQGLTVDSYIINKQKEQL